MYRSNPLTVRGLLPSDAALLHRWLNDPVVLEYYEGRDRPQTDERVQAHFYSGDDKVFRCIVEYDGCPIGYIQYYRLDEEGIRGYGLEEPAAGERIFGMDQFIGEPAYWNRGVGRRLVSSMLRHLEERHRAERVVMDPQTWNGRAVACYEKCGFRKVKLLPGHEWHEGKMRDCWLMERRLEGPYAEV
ncbi:GNAT family N-acetyltransferase [Paenibacillus sp. TAB 01]|uniref:GNAT family N-acetyltransferase n=1 Tax=Paenibacillus sp. TAB 01 TaxID=3368988 RepID=UPI003753057D